MREHDRLEQLHSGRTDEYIRPRFAMLENVPGMFSSNKGEDFRVVLEKFIGIVEPTISIPRPLDKKGRPDKWSKSGFIKGDSWSLAWRQMDAQYYGVPQRRKRVCVLFDFGGGAAGEILFAEYFGKSSDSSGESFILDSSDGCKREIQLEPKGLSRNLESSISPWKSIARDPRESTDEHDTEHSYTLKIRGGSDTYQDWNGQTRGAGKGALIQDDMSATLGVTQDQTLFK